MNIKLFNYTPDLLLENIDQDSEGSDYVSGDDTSL